MRSSSRARVRNVRTLAFFMSILMPLGFSKAIALSSTYVFAGGSEGEISAGSDTLASPKGLSVLQDGSILISDSGSDRIRKVHSTGHVTTFNTSREIDGPDASVPAPDGSLLISETAWNRVVKVSPDGSVRTFAGGGLAPSACVGVCIQYVGDGLPADDASLRSPSGLAIDPDGAAYIADTGNHRIRRVGADGIITTVAGNGLQGFSGDGGKARNAKLNSPMSVGVLPNGDLVVADVGNRRIRLITASGDIFTIAGTGTQTSQGDGGPARSAGFSYPRALAVDAAGQIFVIDSHRIRRIDNDLNISAFAGSISGSSGDGGLATDARFSGPTGLAIAAGSVYVADTNNSRIRKISASGIVSSVAGTGAAIPCCADSGLSGPSARLSSPRGLARSLSGVTFIADSDHHRILRVAVDGTVTTIAGTGEAGFLGDGGPATSARFNFPRALAVDLNGNLFVADGLNYRIRKIDAATGVITTYAGSNCSTFSGDGGPATSACLRTPYGVATDLSGNVFIADTGNNRIRKVDTTGKITTVAGSQIRGFTGDGGQATASGLNFPHGVTVAANGDIYIADTYNSRIRKVDSAGRISTVAGVGPLPCNQFLTVTCDQGAYLGDGGKATSAYINQPYHVAVDQERNIFIADTGNDRIRRVDPSGNIWTVAGNGAGAGLGLSGYGELEYVVGPEAVVALGGSAILFSNTGVGTVVHVLAEDPL